LNLPKGFSKSVILPLAGFESGGRYAAHFSKENCSLATYLPDFKTGEIALAGFQKLFAQL
jgi:hypothetical protein